MVTSSKFDCEEVECGVRWIPYLKIKQDNIFKVYGVTSGQICVTLMLLYMCAPTPIQVAKTPISTEERLFKDNFENSCSILENPQAVKSILFILKHR